MISGSVHDPSSGSTSIFDPDNPMYVIQGDYWEETPELFASELTNIEQISRRDENNKNYRANGECSVWNSYVAFGYHQFDDCYTFAAEWKQVTEKIDPLEKYHLIWNEFTRYLINQEEITNSNLYSWAHNLVLPYLIDHDPDYHLASVCEIEELVQTKLPLDITNPAKTPWTEISKKKKRNSSSSPPRTPTNASKNTPKTNESMLASQLTSLGKATRQRISSILTTTSHTKDKFFTQTKPNNSTTPDQIQTATITMESQPTDKISNPYITKPRSREKTITFQSATQHDDDTNGGKTPHGGVSTQSTMNTKTIPFIAINDGTVRLTVKWKLTELEFDDITNDKNKWEDAAAQLMERLFDNPDTAVTMVQWAASNTSNPKKIHDIRAAKDFSKYHSPKVTKLGSSHHVIFGVRVCLGINSPGPWINHEHTQQVMVADGLTINISNAKSTSGDVVNAGTIFFKHPMYTQRVFYLMALRRGLPETTPFFDLGVMQTTPSGQAIPHIVVRCGTNHVETLTEILSEYLDGGTNSTALFMGNKLLQSMSQEEATNIYNTHQAYVQSIQRLPLHPFIVNIDRLRKEHLPDGQTTERSARDWAASLRNKDGQPLKCDVENGGDDRRAYLLVPTSRLTEGKLALNQYKVNLRRPHQHFSPSSKSPEDQQTRPTEIYIPTAVVLRNLKAMQQMQASAADIWRAAPTTVRHPAPGSNVPRSPASRPITEESSWPNLHTAGFAKITDDKDHGGRQKNMSSNPSNMRRPSMDTTECTTQSPLTRTTTQHQPNNHTSRFDELEAAILRNHEESLATSTRVSQMDDRITRTMAACERVSSQVNNLEAQMSRVFDKLDLIVNRLPSNFSTLNPGESAQRVDHNLPEITRPDIDCCDSYRTPSDSSRSHEDSDTAQTQPSNASSTVRSPEKKKQKQRDRRQSTPPNTEDIPMQEQEEQSDNENSKTDQPGSQYTASSPADGGTT